METESPEDERPVFPFSISRREVRAPARGFGEDPGRPRKDKGGGVRDGSRGTFDGFPRSFRQWGKSNPRHV
ncbi:MAG: hypothetical protein CW346_11580 [Bacillaceae bacterium]|nr:hypothetical protein [Bacillaceae bacterium]